MSHMKIGILDFIPRDREMTAIESFKSAMNLLQLADEKGLARYWFAEHHSTPALLGSSPQVTLGYAAAITEHIRLGTGGVMLDNLSAYQLAENFKVLECLAPHRIEAGVGYSNPKEQADQKEMGGFDFKNPKPYKDELVALYDYMHDQRSVHQEGKARAMPVLFDHEIPYYVMVTSTRHVRYIAEQGWGMLFGLFLNLSYEECKEAIRIYRKYFKPNGISNTPHVMVSLYVISAYDENVLEGLEKAVDAWILTFRSNKRALYQLLSVEEAEFYPFSDEEKETIDHYQEAKLIASPKEIQAKFSHLMKELDCDEFLVVNQLSGYNYRRDLINILADTDL